jgi:hypothetical protein
MALGFALALLSVATRGIAGPADPFEALALVRLDGGVRAPAFTLPDLAGQPTSLLSSRRSAAIVVFWGTW